MPALDPIYSQISFGCHGLSHLEQRSARVHNGNVNIWRGNIAVFETRLLVLIFVGCYWVLWEYTPSLSHRGGPHVRGRENTPNLPNNFLSFVRELGIQFNQNVVLELGNSWFCLSFVGKIRSGCYLLLVTDPCDVYE